MDWQEFIKDITGKHGLSPEDTNTLSCRFPKEDKCLDEKQLAAKLNIGEDAVTKRMQKIYNKFHSSCPKLMQKGAGKSGILHNYLRQQYRQPEDTSGSEVVIVSNLSPYPPEFEPLIKEKVRMFCGRKFVFDAFEKFCNDHRHGYFTVVGDAGMGKSSIAAKYTFDSQAICYFNILAERRNRSELFLKSIRQQLINRYELQNAAEADLPTLLAKVSQKLPDGQRLVIVVDALDEVNQEPGENLLHLPMTLPDRVYFLLTRRPYNLEKKRLSVSPGVPVVELDLTANRYSNFNREDVKEYISLFLKADIEYGEALRKWILDRKITDEKFVEQVAEKSISNFMYLRYVLPEIARGFYNDLSLKQLPDGLQEYYQTHWMRMKMDTPPREVMAIALFILVEIGTPIPCQMMAAIADEEEYEVQSVLDEWVGYLTKQEIDRDLCYSIYHASFLDFLKGKGEMKSTRKLFKEVNQRIVDYWEREMNEDDAEDC